MDKRLLLILGIIVLSFIVLGFIFGNHKWVGSVITLFEEDSKDSYSYTTAMCNASNHCQDYEVSCEDGEMTKMNPIMGAVIQHADDWVDSREESNGLCG